MTEARLEHRTMKISQLVDDYRSGRIVIPEFQREYVWKKSKAPKLIDSLYRGFPISSLLLWKSDEEVTSRRMNPKPGRSGVSWLIDGQQRVITLAHVIEQEIDVVFNPDQEEFALVNAATRQDPNWFRVAELFDEETFRRIRKDVPDNSKGRTREARFDKLRSILSYEVPIVEMVDHGFREAVEAFKRINTLGMKLKTQDIESAEIAAKHTGFIKDDVTPFLSEIRKLGYSRINVMHLFRVCAYLAHPDGRQRTPLHELSQKEVQGAWRETKKATYTALELIRGELKLVNMEILWSGSLLVPVIALCALPPRERNNREIAGWLALASLFHRYSGASETALDQDMKACRSADPIGGLLSNVRGPGGLFVEPNHFIGSLADRGGLFGVYIACMHRGLKDFFNEGNVILQSNVDRHHILPRAQFPEKTRKEADNIANIAFISGATNKSVNSSGPEVYLKSIPKSVLQSQCIPIDPALWSIEKSYEFWEARRELLAEAFNDYIKMVLPKRKR